MHVLETGFFQSHIKNVHEKGAIIAHCEVCGRGFHTKTRASQCRRQHIKKNQKATLDNIK